MCVIIAAITEKMPFMNCISMFIYIYIIYYNVFNLLCYCILTTSKLKSSS